MTTEDDWIPISKEFPPPNQWLFVVYRCAGGGFRRFGRTGGQHVTTAHTFYEHNGKPLISLLPELSCTVTHWMIQTPLPKDDDA
jgi:hypothetical protein